MKLIYVEDILAYFPDSNVSERQRVSAICPCGYSSAQTAKVIVGNETSVRCVRSSPDRQSF